MSQTSQVPSPAQLADDYAFFLREGMKPEAATQFRASVALIDQAVLKHLSGHLLHTKCTNIYWIDTGGFNCIFLLEFEDGREAIARVARPDVAGDAEEIRETLLGQVGTMMWLRKHTDIPVAEVYAYCLDADCGVGSAFVLQERIHGRPPSSDWIFIDQEMTKQFMAQIIEIWAKLMHTRLPAIGTLIPDEAGLDGVVGPVAWGGLDRTVPLDKRGPFKLPSAYCQALLDCHDPSRVLDEPRSARDTCPPDTTDEQYPLHQRKARTLDMYREQLDMDQQFVLHHIDLQLQNILVSYDKPLRIVGLLDWDNARVVPLFEAAVLPEVLSSYKGYKEEEAIWKRALSSADDVEKRRMEYEGNQRVVHILTTPSPSDPSRLQK